MRDDLKAILGTPPQEYDQRYFADIIKKLELFLDRLVATGPVRVSDVDATGDVSVGGTLSVDGETIGDLATKDVASLTADVSGVLPIANGGTGASSASGARTELGAQASLGYTPVQQGTGIGQLGNAVKIGWTSSGYPKMTVDVTDIGRIWTDYEVTRSLGSTGGYQKFPGGLIEQWGQYAGGLSDFTVTLPVAMPTSIDNIQILVVGNTGAIKYASATAADKNGFTVAIRDASGGTTTAALHWTVKGH